MVSRFNGRLPQYEDGYNQFCDISLWVSGTLVKKYEKCYIDYTYGNAEIDVSTEEPVIEGCTPKGIYTEGSVNVTLIVTFADETYATDPWEMQIDNFVKEEISE